MHTLAWIEIWKATDLDLNQFRRVLQRICIFRRALLPTMTLSVLSSPLDFSAPRESIAKLDFLSGFHDLEMQVEDIGCRHNRTQKWHSDSVKRNIVIRFLSLSSRVSCPFLSCRDSALSTCTRKFPVYQLHDGNRVPHGHQDEYRIRTTTNRNSREISSLSLSLSLSLCRECRYFDIFSKNFRFLTSPPFHWLG